VQVAMAEESNGPVSFFDDQMIIPSETCILESITPKYQRTVPNILSKVLILIQPIGLYIILFLKASIQTIRRISYSILFHD